MMKREGNERSTSTSPNGEMMMKMLWFSWDQTSSHFKNTSLLLGFSSKSVGLCVKQQRNQAGSVMIKQIEWQADGDKLISVLREQQLSMKFLRLSPQSIFSEFMYNRQSGVHQTTDASSWAADCLWTEKRGAGMELQERWEADKQAGDGGRYDGETKAETSLQQMKRELKEACRTVRGQQRWKTQTDLTDWALLMLLRRTLFFRLFCWVVKLLGPGDTHFLLGVHEHFYPTSLFRATQRSSSRPKPACLLVC